jgi:serine/threonine protein kinase
MRTYLPAGTQIAGYRVESLIGRGGMAVVYRAEHLRLGRRVALKLIAPEFAEHEKFRQRFMRESRLAAAIDHPNILPVYEADEAEGLLYLAMRYVEGIDLKGLLAEQGRLDTRQVLSILSQVASALDVAHARSLIHRDVKPGNILLVPGPDAEEPYHVYLADFGLTKRSSSDSGLTGPGQFVGTIDYIAPEQITGKPVGPQADIYALGCVLFECLTGAIPFERDEDLAVLWAHVQEPPPSVTSRNPALPTAVDAVLATAMAKSPEDRFSTCRQLMGALRSALRDGPPTISGPQPILASVPSASGEPQLVPSTKERQDEPLGTKEGRRLSHPQRPQPQPVRLGDPRWTRSLLILGLVVLLALAGMAGTVLFRSGNRNLTFAASDQLPFSFSYPNDWQKHTHAGFFTVLSPHDLIDFYSDPEKAWTDIRPLLAKDAENVVGAYLPLEVAYLDIGAQEAVEAKVEALLPEKVEFGSHEPRIIIDGRPTDRVQGRVIDPSHPDTWITFTDYVIQAKPGVAVQLMLFASDQAVNSHIFDRIIGSVRFDQARLARLS